MKRRVRLPEIWKPIMGLEVSSTGRVRKGGKILKQHKNNWGYCYVWAGLGISVSVHSLVCEAFHGPKPTSKHEVNHDNGHKNDNWFENVGWSTRSENMKHAFASGLSEQKKGAKNPDAKKYLFTSPKGEKIIHVGLRDFCRKNDLCVGRMAHVVKGRAGHHKGWKGELLS